MVSELRDRIEPDAFTYDRIDPSPAGGDAFPKIAPFGASPRLATKDAFGDGLGGRLGTFPQTTP